MARNPNFFIASLLLICSTSYLQAGTDPLRKVAAELADGITRYGKVTVAVLNVSHHDNHASDGPLTISEKLTTYLVSDKRLKVIERNHLQQILKELHLSDTGTLDTKTAKRVGEVLGADVLVVGTLINLSDGKSEMNARGLLASNGRIITASRTLLERTWENQCRLDW